MNKILYKTIVRLSYETKYRAAFDRLRLTAFCHVEHCHTELVEVLSKHRQKAVFVHLSFLIAQWVIQSWIFNIKTNRALTVMDIRRLRVQDNIKNFYRQVCFDNVECAHFLLIE